MITPAYALTATERVLPRMALDFTTGILDSRVSVTRALNTATRVNSSGFIEIVNANLPRFDYDPTTLAPKGLLIEEQRTNQIIYSNDFRTTEEVGSTRAWLLAVGSSVVTTNYAVSPDGTSNANLMSITTNFYSGRQQNFTATSGVAYTFSFWIKRLSGGTSGSVQIFGDGIISASTAFTSTANWQRITVTGTASANGLAGVYIYPNYTGSGSGEYLLYGAQLEAGAFATSYIPTTTSSLTRNADAVTMTGTNFSSWYNPSQGTFVTSAAIALSGLTRVIVGGGSLGYPNYIRNTNVGAIFDGVSPGFTLNSITAAPFKLATKYGNSLMSACLNADAVGNVIYNGNLASLTSIALGSSNLGTLFINGHLSSVDYYNIKLTDAEMRAFTN